MRETADETKISFKRLALLAIAMTLLLGSAIMVPTARGAQPTNPYPANKPTFWAWQNRPDLPPNLGLPADWNENALQQGWSVGQYPRPRAIAVFEANVWGAPAVGHVAVVEQVYDDGSYLASEMSDKDCRYDSSTCGKVHKTLYPITAGMSFIYTRQDTRTTWSFASGGSGWTSRDLAEGYMGGPGWYYPLAGSDPQLLSPELSIPLQGYTAVEIVMATGIPVADPQLQLYFATAAQPDFSEARSVKLAASADGALHTYRIDLSTHKEWKGNLTRLRLDPSGPGTKGGVRIDLIRLISAPAPIEEFGTFSYASTGGGGRKGR